MLNLKYKIDFEYNEMYDILYVKLKECHDSYGDEEINGIVLNYDYNTNEFVGADIWDFKKRMKRNERIILPVDIDFKEIYNNL